MSENSMSLWQNLPRIKISRISKPPFYEDSYWKPYRHLQLENERTIRLLILQPAKSKDQHLFCEIIHTSLDDPPLYEALSYTWDSQIPQLWLTCPDGSQILVTLNCEAALRRLRYKTRPRFLWVDAICINQTRVEERNAQVAMMAEIYRSAANVVIWLGLGDAETKLAFKYLTRAHFIWYYDWKRHSRLPGEKGLFSYRMLLTGCTPDALASLANRSYWTRIWTLQELAGSKAFVYCRDSKSISAHYLILVLLRLSKVYPDTFGAIFKTYLHLKCFKHFRGEKCNLLHVFHQVCRMSASDARDKVSALRGLFPETLSSFEVDYSKPIWQVFLEATRAVIVNEHSLAFLTYVSRKPGAHKEPSWVVNWDDKTLLLYPTTIHKSSKNSRPHFYFPRSDSILILYGVGIATVAGNCSILLPSVDTYRWRYVYDGHPINYKDQNTMFLKAVCDLYDSSAAAIFRDFDTFFRSAIQFLLSREKSYSMDDIDELLTFVKEKKFPLWDKCDEFQWGPRTVYSS